jgi:hypothetical protein
MKAAMLESDLTGRSRKSVLQLFEYFPDQNSTHSFGFQQAALRAVKNASILRRRNGCKYSLQVGVDWEDSTSPRLCRPSFSISPIAAALALVDDADGCAIIVDVRSAKPGQLGNPQSDAGQRHGDIAEPVQRGMSSAEFHDRDDF